jgi:serine/threonine-protein phosphatase 4 regulatory subunit 1
LKVRQEAINNLPIISKEVSQSFFRNRLLKFYQKKSNETNWGIRKSCVDIIIDMSSICDDATREGPLTEIMLNFIKDQHKWVKIPAYKNLGPFIAALKGRIINERLLEAYFRMSTHEINDLSLENEIFYSCAYNFPAVLYTLGPASW